MRQVSNDTFFQEYFQEMRQLWLLFQPLECAEHPDASIMLMTQSVHGQQLESNVVLVAASHIESCIKER